MKNNRNTPGTFFVVFVTVCLILSSCTLTPPASTPPTVTSLPTTPALPAVPTARISTSSPIATPSLTDTETPPSPPVPYSPTPTLAGPAIAHFVPGRKIDITYIHMVDTDQGWGIGGLNKASDHVFRTLDGGQTWRDVTPPQPVPDAGDEITALGYFMDATTAWVAYGPPMESGGMPPYIQVWKTTDGGGTWFYASIDTSPVSGEAFSPYFLNFADVQHGWLMVYLGAGMMHAYVAIFMTSDGGATWTDIMDPYTGNDIQSFPKTGMVFVDPQTGWLTRDAQDVDPTPHIFRTADGGVTWTRLDLPAPADAPNLYDSHACGTYSPNAFSALSVTVAMKCLDTATFKIEKDYAYFTGDGGITWNTYPLPADYTLGEGLDFISPQIGLALGRKIYKTSDGGQTWKFIQQVTWDGQFSFLSMDLGWAHVSNDQGEIALVKTVNGGATWTLLHPVVGP
jgi:photosystem II stability/assembly factor-like uncharacterized protein